MNDDADIGVERREVAVAADQGKNPFLVTLGERVRTLRARRGLTRKAAAIAADVSERHFANLEYGIGNASILVLQQVATALQCSLAELVGDVTTISPEWLLIRELLENRSEADLRRARIALGELLGTAAGDPARHRRIALIGLRGAGKSTLGRMLAEQRGIPFFELDGEVEREAGLAVGAIIELHGQAAFRRLERQALERLVTEREAVIAAGGGIVADQATFDLLLGHCRTVWIRASPEEHMRRVIEQGDLRPMQDDNRQAMRDLRAILTSREALYARADLVLDTSGKMVGESFLQLVDLMRLETSTVGADNQQR
jgi:XRE family aerobic/anaerobic benzoate catabolism transcriptional regulator